MRWGRALLRLQADDAAAARDAAWAAHAACATPHQLLDLPDVDVSAARALEWLSVLADAYADLGAYRPGAPARPRPACACTADRSRSGRGEGPPAAGLASHAVLTWRTACAPTALVPSRLDALALDWTACAAPVDRLGAPRCWRSSSADEHP